MLQYDVRSQERSEDEEVEGDEPSATGRGGSSRRRPYWRTRNYSGAGGRGRPYRGRGRGSRPVSNGYDNDDSEDNHGNEDQSEHPRGGRRYFPRYYRPRRYTPVGIHFIRSHVQHLHCVLQCWHLSCGRLGTRCASLMHGVCFP